MYNIAIPLSFLHTDFSTSVPYIEIPFDFGGGSYTNCYYQISVPFVTNKLPVKYGGINTVSRLNKVSATKIVNFTMPIRVTFDGATASTKYTYNITLTTDPLNNIIKITPSSASETPPLDWGNVNSTFAFLSITLTNE